MKTCRLCGTEKPFNGFAPRARSRDGLRAQCRDCRSTKARSAYTLNIDKHRAKGRRSMQLARTRHPERNKAVKARDYEKNRAARLATIKRWRERNPERVIALAMKSGATRRSRLEGVAAERVDRLVVFSRDKWTCGLCRLPVAKADASIDHIIPIAKGGSHTYQNCQTAHLKCNLSKGARFMGQLRLCG